MLSSLDNGSLDAPGDILLDSPDHIYIYLFLDSQVLSLFHVEI